MTTKSKIETKEHSGILLEVKQEDRNGVPVGLLMGYAATWDVDRGDWMGVKDQFVKGCFLESLMEHIVKKRQIRFKDHHGRTVGGAPMATVKEDDRGLYVVAEVNLEVQQGRELYALAKQGVIVDFSIGFSVVDFELDGNLRTISKAIVWEFSGVDEPCNPHAQITQVKQNEDNEVKTYNTEDVKDWGKRELEQALREGAKFSKNAAKAIISLNIWTGKDEDEDDEEVIAKKAAESKQLDDILAGIKGISASIGAG